MIYSDWIPGPKIWARLARVVPEVRKSGSDSRSSRRHWAPVAMLAFPVGHRDSTDTSDGLVRAIDP